MDQRLSRMMPLIVAAGFLTFATWRFLGASRASPPDVAPAAQAEPAVAAWSNPVGRTWVDAFTDARRAFSERLRALQDAPVRDLDDRQRDAVLALLRDPADSDSLRNEAIVLLRECGEPRLVPALLNRLDDRREPARFRRFAAQHLGVLLARAEPATQAELRDHLRRLLDDRHPEVRREALLALSRLRDPVAFGRLAGLLADPRDDLADLAVRIVGEASLVEHRAAIHALVEAPVPAVATAAIAVAAAWRDRDCRAGLDRAAASPHPDVRDAAERALLALGQPAGGAP